MTKAAKRMRNFIFMRLWSEKNGLESAAAGLVHDADHLVLDLARGGGGARRIEHREQRRGLDCREDGAAAFLVDRDPAGQCGRDLDGLAQHDLRLFGVTDLDYAALAGERHAL